jgi:hypothetical protein
MADANLTAPVIKITGHTEVHIGLARADASFDCDYNYSGATSWTPPNSPYLMVPLVGTWDAQTPLKVDGSGKFGPDLVLTTQLYAVTGQIFSSSVDHANPGSLGPPDPTRVTGSGTVVTFNYPLDANPVATTASLVYQAIPDSLSEHAAPGPNTIQGFLAVLCAMNFQFKIPTKLPPFFKPLIICSDQWPNEDKSQFCSPVKNLRFWWHCLADGTRVVLADGSTCRIEDVDNRCRVRTGNGNGTLGVEATTRGLHHAVRDGHHVSGIYRLTTQEGRSLILTGGHPVVTEDGLVPASSLRPRMTIHGVDGLDRVAELESVEDHDGYFCNLKLIDAGDRARGLAGSVGTFFANGILVGDHASMEQVHYNNTHSIDYMRTVLPERYHQDYESTLAQIVQDNVKYGANF